MRYDAPVLGLGSLHRLLTSDQMVTLPPWNPGGSSDISQIATLPQEVAQAFGINTTTDSVTFDQALSIPAVRQGYQTIAGRMGATPLVCVRERAGNPPEVVPRSFLAQPDPACTRAATLTDTVGSLMMFGIAYWFTLTKDANNFPAQARYLHPSRVTIDTVEQVVRVDGEEVDWRRLIAFRGPDRGLLYHGARTLKTALMLEDAVRRFSSMDVPLGLITDDQGTMLEDEITVFLDSWERARRAHTTGYLPVGLHYENPNFNAEQVQLSDARNFLAAEIARLMNMPPSAVNAPSNDSLTYSTTVLNAQQLVDMTFAPYRAAMEGRLSMPDVTPLGTTVFMDFSEWLRGDINNTITTGAAAVAAGLMTKDEVRQNWLHLGPLPEEASSGTQQQP